MKRIATRLSAAFLVAYGLTAPAVAAEAVLLDKTLVVWAAPANPTQRGGSVLTIDDGQRRFDGLILGEHTPKKWMPGSEGFSRTLSEQANWPEETADGKTFVQIAVAYQDRQVTIYRNGRQYAQYTMGGTPLTYGNFSITP